MPQSSMNTRILNLTDDHRRLQIQQRRTEMVLDALERALTSEEETDELIAHFQSDCAGQDDTDTLPVHLRDPFAVIERGNFLLANGIPSKRPTCRRS